MALPLRNANVSQTVALMIDTDTTSHGLYWSNLTIQRFGFLDIIATVLAEVRVMMWKIQEQPAQNTKY